MLTSSKRQERGKRISIALSGKPKSESHKAALRAAYPANDSDPVRRAAIGRAISEGKRKAKELRSIAQDAGTLWGLTP